MHLIVAFRERLRDPLARVTRYDGPAGAVSLRGARIRRVVPLDDDLRPSGPPARAGSDVHLTEGQLVQTD